MRSRSPNTGGLQVHAVSGTRTVSFAISATQDVKTDLMGFQVSRTDMASGHRATMHNVKVFKSLIPRPTAKTWEPTSEHPIQTFVWDDFNVEADHKYVYEFTPLTGRPGALRPKRQGWSSAVRVKTEPAFSHETHDVFFNAGIASSQAYVRHFGNKKPSELGHREQEAIDWLSRDLCRAIIAFIGSATKKDTLRCCFYEFTYPPVLDALKTAAKAGVDLKIIIDAKRNGYTDKQGKKHTDSPRTENLKAIANAKLPKSVIIERRASKNAIQHNKFIVLLKGKGAKAKPAEVWTGSTNITTGGITGQTNVGHWVRDRSVADAFMRYWNLLAGDPGIHPGDARADSTNHKQAFQRSVETLGPVPASVSSIATGVTPVFSPRRGNGVLDLYAKLLDSAKSSGAITLAFGIGMLWKHQLQDNTDKSALTFLLLEKRDLPPKPKKGTKKSTTAKTAWVSLNAKHNIYEAWGSYIQNPVYQWAKETNSKALALTKWVVYIHSKVLLRDPLSADPIVVSGSANFSAASTNENDENMLVIRGDKRVADIYFTEFNRLFFHYYFRSVLEAVATAKTPRKAKSLFLDESGTEWVKDYAPGKFKTKRVAVFEQMVL
jgi:phosphatidylserine/phosphatidylglycerophosphate/cardiolipin synthase-like enzyme